MQFKLNAPCKSCPFKKDTLKGWLGESRAEDLVKSIIHEEKTFSCHKTTGVLGNEPKDTQMCAGALLLILKELPGHRMLRIAEHFNMLDTSEVRGKDLVFDTAEDFIKHHS